MWSFALCHSAVELSGLTEGISLGRCVVNVVIKCHTAHITECSLVSIYDYYFLWCLLGSTDVLYVVLTPQKAPEEVVTDGYKEALYVQSDT
jgi:hypothetical protein